MLTGAQQELQIKGTGRCCQIFMVAGVAGEAGVAEGSDESPTTIENF